MKVLIEQLLTKREKPEAKKVFGDLKSYLEKSLPGSVSIDKIENIAAGVTTEILAEWEEA